MVNHWRWRHGLRRHRSLRRISSDKRSGRMMYQNAGPTGGAIFLRGQASGVRQLSSFCCRQYGGRSGVNIRVSGPNGIHLTSAPPPRIASFASSRPLSRVNNAGRLRFAPAARRCLVFSACRPQHRVQGLARVSTPPALPAFAGNSAVCAFRRHACSIPSRPKSHLFSSCKSPQQQLRHRTPREFANHNFSEAAY